MFLKSSLGTDKDPTLWHYTGASGFLGILESKSIWASSLVFLNDSREFFEASIVASSVISDKNLDKNLERIILKVLHSCSGRCVTSIDIANVAAISFSQKGDDLGQWRAYADDTGGGYCLGFAKSKLEEIASNLGGSMRKVEYDLPIQKKLISPIVDRFISSITGSEPSEKAVANYERNGQAELLGSNVRAAVDVFTADYRKVAPIIKNKAFSEECEYRLILDGQKGVKVRATEYGIVPYYTVALGDSFALRALIIGPSRRITRNLEAALLALGSSGFTSNSTVASSLPYRSW